MDQAIGLTVVKAGANGILLVDCLAPGFAPARIVLKAASGVGSLTFANVQTLTVEGPPASLVSRRAEPIWESRPSANAP